MHPLALGDSIYVIGGYESRSFDPQSTLYRYDVLTDAWTSVAPLPEAGVRWRRRPARASTSSAVREIR